MARLKTKPPPEKMQEMATAATSFAELTDLGQPNSEMQPDKLDKILDTSKRTRESLETKIDGVSIGLNLLRNDHSKLVDRVT